MEELRNQVTAVDRIKELIAKLPHSEDRVPYTTAPHGNAMRL